MMASSIVGLICWGLLKLRYLITFYSFKLITDRTRISIKGTLADKIDGVTEVTEGAYTEETELFTKEKR